MEGRFTRTVVNVRIIQGFIVEEPAFVHVTFHRQMSVCSPCVKVQVCTKRRRYNKYIQIETMLYVVN